MNERGFELFAPEDEPTKDSEVFYNKEMTVNRDLSQIAGKIFEEQVDIDNFTSLDAFAASGIRGFRYHSFSNELFLCDANPKSIDSIKKGLEHNDIEANVIHENVNNFLTGMRNRFHFIDIDPFGSFLEYLDSTVRASNHTSFVGLTATDNSVTSGSYKTTCRRRYGSIPLKNSFMHETGLRIYIKEVFENYARFDMAFDPKVCWHEKHYSRVMGRVNESKKRANRDLDNIGYLSYCSNCRWRKLEKVSSCEICSNSDLKYSGPLWTGKISDQRFTEEMLEEIPDNWEDSRKLLDKIHGEAEILTPFYDLHQLGSNLNIQVPRRDEVIESIRNKGYPVSRTHFSPTGFRTDAPIDDVKKIIMNID